MVPNGIVTTTGPRTPIAVAFTRKSDGVNNMYLGGWIDSDVKACRIYGRLALLLAAVILIPPIVVDIVLTVTGNTVMGVGALYGILIDYEDRVPAAPSLGKYRATFLLMLAGLLLAATICTFFSVTMLRLASKSRVDPERSAQARRKCRLLLLNLNLLPFWALLIGIVLAAFGIKQFARILSGQSDRAVFDGVGVHHPARPCRSVSLGCRSPSWERQAGEQGP